jgi:hypothetical protein
MEAFPKVLKRIPNARLVVAGANHHTRAGYWESIRDAQPPELPIEFRGYVPEDDIPELFRTTSVLVLPYDSATGSSGPAHQACEYGLPIVCADIPDFHGMVEDEEMAVRFYKTGNADDLADQLIAILSSHELQRHMSEHNFAAGIDMTMSSVVGKYLRWFELNKAKRAIGDSGMPRQSPRRWSRGLSNRDTSPRWRLHPGLFASRSANGHSPRPASEGAVGEPHADPFTGRASRTEDHASHETQPQPTARSGESTT